MRKKLLVILLAFALIANITACQQKPAEESTEVAKEEVKEEETKKEEDHDHDHEHGAYEWIGEFELKKGKYLFHFGASPDETMKVAFVKLGANVTDLEHHASHVMVTDAEKIENDSEFDAKPDFAYEFQMNPDHGHFHFNIAEDGTYAIVTEHMPSENNMQIFDENKVEILPSAEHEGEGHNH